MLYQWEIGRVSPEEACERHWQIEQEGPELAGTSRRFAEDLAEGTIAHLQSIDARIEAQAQHWRLERMAVIDRLILRMAVYEFLYRPETPRTVVIDEAIELARTFSEQDAVRFVNGVLDGIHHTMAAGGTIDA
ncbi:MAG: transcription antitermination factor NusB [Acidobacteria bacterium]|jgi:N utilization substance protein B|nr:transcription antitermination factor NusB [Acidobacteriota bacterium]